MNKIQYLVEHPHPCQHYNQNQVDEECPWKGLHVIGLHHVVQHKLIGKAPEDPADGPDHQIGAGETGGEDDNFDRVFEGEQAAWDGE